MARVGEEKVKSPNRDLLKKQLIVNDHELNVLDGLKAELMKVLMEK